MVPVTVFLSQAMQQPLRAVAKGYSLHITGRVPADRLLALAAKFEAIFKTDASYSTRQSRRRRGVANYYFFAHPRRGSTSFDWWLLSTEGTPPKGVNEQWRDASKQGQRLRYQDRFEAVQMPAKGGAPRWTWRLTQRYYAELEVAISTAIRKRGGDDELAQLLHGIHRMPGFRGVRGQVAALRRHTVAEWRRARDGAECPHLPPRVQGFQRYSAVKSVPAELVIERVLKGLDPIDFEWRRNVAPDATEIPDVSDADPVGAMHEPQETTADA